MLERGAVVGPEFSRSELAAVWDGTDPTAALRSLLRRDLLRCTGAEGFRFRHALLRDVAYGTMTKELRADLHERFASAGEADLPRSHLEQACRLRLEVVPGDRSATALATA